MKILPRSFYTHSPLQIAPDLLGKILVRKLNGQIISGRIVEVEAYLGGTDEASHAFIGKTNRNVAVFGEGGHAYVHSIHMQNCLDVVTETINVPSSVLIRALEPLEGIEFMKKFRKKESLKDLTTGPGKLTQALQITKAFNGYDLCDPNGELFLADDNYKVDKYISKKRIGISKAKELDLRFYIAGNLYISKK